jgi:hypothetical protein
VAKIPNRVSNTISQNYEKRDNTFIQEKKSNPKDRIEVEIGDSKTPDSFLPQVKVMRWDNEVNASFRYVDTELGEAQIRTEGKVIKYVKPKTEFRAYDLDPKEGLEDGGLEIELLLKEKPDTNKFEFTLQTKGLDFFYQPELTQKEIDEGGSRPDDVAGSYAVYHKTKGGMNRADGMEYKAGKAFHIYRPFAYDANGDGIYADLNVDVEAGILTVTVDQKFLDNAVYPVVVDPTFGYTTNGGSSAGIAGRNDMFETWTESRLGDIYAGAVGTLDKISGVFNSTASRDIKVFLNTKDSGGSGNHGQVAVVEVANTTFAKAAFTDFTAGGESISAVDYILNAETNSSEIADGESITLDYDTVTARAGYSEAYSSGSFKYASPESPWLVASGSKTQKLSIYATYTAGSITVIKDFLGSGFIPFAR